MNMNCERVQQVNGKPYCSLFDGKTACANCHFYRPTRPEKPSRDIKDIGNTTYWRKKS